jgi:MoaA/NifB/PqqE/SkfB family radical SAM enzyme
MSQLRTPLTKDTSDSGGTVHRYVDFILAALRSTLVTRKPFFLAHSVTYACNSRCRTCSAWSMSPMAYKDLSTVEVYDLLSQAYQCGMRGYYLFGGEPLVRRDIGSIIECAKHQGFVTTINTNGSLLQQKASTLAEHLDFAFIFLDYPNEYHDYIRGRRGSFQEVLKGIRLLLEAGHTKVTLVTTISKLNLHQIEAMAQFAQQLGVGLSYNTVEPTWTATYHGRATSVVDNYGLDEAELRYFYAKLLELKHRGYPLMESEWVLRDYAIQKPWVCHFPKVFVYVSPDGFIFPCTHTFDHPLVDLRDTSFTEYFASGIYRDHVKKAEHCNECLRTCVRMYTYTYALHPLHLLTLTTAARMWARQIRHHKSAKWSINLEPCRSTSQRVHLATRRLNHDGAISMGFLAHGRQSRT